MKDLFVCSADAHVKQHAWASRPDIAGDAAHSFRQVGKFCRDNNLPWVFTGDLFDVPTLASEDVAVVREEFDMMEEARLPFLFIQGQHDKSTPSWPLALSRWPIALNDQLIPIGEDVEQVHLLGIDALKRHELEPKLAQINAMTLPPKTILCCHQLLKETFKLDEGWDMTMDWVTNPSIKLVLMGDDHRQTDLSKRTKWIYPGAGHVTRITESLSKSFIVISTDGNGLFARRVALNTRRYIRMTMTTEAELDRAVKYVEETAVGPLTVDGMKPVLIAAFVDTLTDAERRLNASNGGKFIFWPEVTAVERPAELAEFEAAPVAVGAGLRECLGRCLTPGSEAFDLTDQMLESPTALPTIFKEWRTKKGVT